ncbi:DUF2306 domain-containing protein [Bacillus sp. mrc49]|uniref:DUF2306 domain-containing protein n=1 Tax=Bacillus sp. mrc49 TaxID=2054913 RepID=UPI001E6513D7|nr:DUF2306 domain-containing protein [Bacillus sp. mrc49]
MKDKVIRTTILIIPLMWVLHTLSKNFMVDPNFQGFLSKKDELLANELLWVIMIRIHIMLAIISLLTGPLGIIKSIRVKFLKFHRWNGRIYVLSIALNYIPGLYVSFFATGGWVSTVGFLILNTLWITTTLLGYSYIKKRQVLAHSKWMVRSYFLSFANMIIYIIVVISHNALSFSYDTSYTIAVWLCWMLNLSLAELFIRKKIV